MGFFWIPLLVMAVCFLIGMPVALSLIVSGIIYFVATGADVSIAISQMCTKMFANYTILAVPMFVLMANLMNSGKVTTYLFDFCKALVGRRRGALAQVNVFVSLIFSGMSGSAVADASGIGLIEVDAMKKDGYDAPFAAALTAATSTVGPIVPPSIPLVTYAMLSGASIGALFLGGILPGIVLSGLMAVYVNIVARKRQYPRGNKYTVKTFLLRTFRAIPAMLTPVILFIGIYGGVITPTEAGAIASLWALLIALFIYRSMTFKQVLLALRNTALQTGVITIMTTASFVMSYLVAAEGISTAIANWVLSITSNKYVLLLVINCVFLILGMVIDVSVMMYVFVPLVLPIITACGISLVHFGVMITLNMMIGLSTPPFGMCLFVGSSISGAKVSDISKKILPMCMVLIAALLLITYIPAIVTWLPSVCGY